MSRRIPNRSFEDTLTWLRGLKLSVKAHSGKTDRLLKSTRLDSNIYADLRDGDEALDAAELTASEKLRSFPALSQDIFQSFYSLSQQKTPEEQLTTEAREINARLLENVTSQDDYPTLKNVCEERELLAYEAAGEFISRTADRLDSLLGDIAGEKGPVNTLKKLEAAAEDAAERLAALAAQAQAGPEPDEAVKKSLPP